MPHISNICLRVEDVVQMVELAAFHGLLFDAQGLKESDGFA
jgi:hypothetical protein